MYRIIRIGRKSIFYSREKCLIGLVLVALCFFCFAGNFLLPDNFGSSRVLRVYKHIQKSGLEIFIAAPSNADQGNASHRIEDPDFMSDLQSLLDKTTGVAQAGDQAETPAPEAPLMDQPHWDSEWYNDVDTEDDLSLIGTVAAPVSDDDGGARGPSELEQVHLPLGGGGNDQAPDALNVTLKERRQKVKEMMLHAWNNYKRYAWGKNELRPLSRLYHWGGVFQFYDLGVTIVDGLDTLYIMGLEKEYQEARDWIDSEFSLDFSNAELNVFEMNIRFVGSMLTLYAFTGDPLYKQRAQHIVHKLLPAFQTPTGIPYALVSINNGQVRNHNWASGGTSILSEFGTLHLEFTYLSDITGIPLYRELVQTIRKVLKKIEKPNGLYPNYLDPLTGKWGLHHMSLGGLGDSYYEYLLKAWLQSGQKDEEAHEMFDEAMLAILDRMVCTSRGGLIYVSDLKSDWLEHKMDHLACFSGGLFALAAATRQNNYSDRYMAVGKGITNTCHESYIRTPTKLGPESFRFSEALEARALRSEEKIYILRPEVIESYFYLWRLTHDEKYRDWGWEVVLALEKHCRTDHGYCGLRNVYHQKPQKDDVQQSYFLAETLKYLYLLFSDDSVLPLDKWVFNTEAHPLPIKGANEYYRQAVTRPVSNAS